MVRSGAKSVDAGGVSVMGRKAMVVARFWNGFWRRLVIALAPHRCEMGPRRDGGWDGGDGGLVWSICLFAYGLQSSRLLSFVFSRLSFDFDF